MLRGEVWLVRLDPTIGTEISKTRPAVIVNDNAIGILPLKVIVPITDWKETFASRPWMVRLEASPNSGLSKLSGADTFQVRSVSETRLVKRLRDLDDTTMQAISEALATVLAID
ncbi:type II toxin-antitoxin system PemK/MazF family toxin [Leptolyngbya sp. FACHB-36]|uniref:type II toxin-antitoxin system PemK/MazF family toxin n=1 Tax=Leptolyngbya sp. FACHB-36 TaxID=2692808 RepID=UPI001680D5D7|nr:type II toxin-antitoxin system PemK/MazF family toxin [Leptolyngbya sp. FACHB-36]MBD2021880.1 type II toxin-antitoxin system PemK/MazF family toxin [Leptolyngbya sp. FACHB-36]